MELIGAGRSLLIYPDTDSKPHVWFVLTDPVGMPGKVVAVMIQSAKPYTDSTVLLEHGDHPFIRHQTSVSFGQATFFTLEKLQRYFQKGMCHLLQDMSAALLDKVRKGLLASARTPHSIRAYCQSQF